MPGASGAEVKVTGVPKGKGAGGRKHWVQGTAASPFFPCLHVHRGWHVCTAGAPSARAAEDFEMAVAKVQATPFCLCWW